MHPVDDAHPHQVFRSFSPEEVPGGGVRVEERPGIVDDDGVPGRLGQHPVLLLALPQCFFGSLLRGDVVDDEDNLVMMRLVDPHLVVPVEFPAVGLAAFGPSALCNPAEHGPEFGGGVGEKFKEGLSDDLVSPYPISSQPGR